MYHSASILSSLTVVHYHTLCSLLFIHPPVHSWTVTQIKHHCRKNETSLFWLFMEGEQKEKKKKTSWRDLFVGLTIVWEGVRIDHQPTSSNTRTQWERHTAISLYSRSSFDGCTSEVSNSLSPLLVPSCDCLSSSRSPHPISLAPSLDARRERMSALSTHRTRISKHS